eukprot:UC4_evm1s894
MVIFRKYEERLSRGTEIRECELFPDQHGRFGFSTVAPEKKNSKHQGVYVSGIGSGTVAEKVDMRIGDQLLEINGKTLQKCTQADAARLISGAKVLKIKL